MDGDVGWTMAIGRKVILSMVQVRSFFVYLILFLPKYFGRSPFSFLLFNFSLLTSVFHHTYVLCFFTWLLILLSFQPHLISPPLLRLS
jgi:hypothetical protein